jgi:integrase
MDDKVRSLPISLWPQTDREAWAHACRPSMRLNRGGAACRMKPKTQASHARGYGYFLDYCRRHGQLEDGVVASLVTPTRIDHFLEELRERVRSVTHWSYIQRIRRVCEILAPTRDVGWLRDVEADLRDAARPRAKYPRIVDGERLIRLGLELMDRGEAGEHLTLVERSRLVRNGLMIALLSLCPIRLGNLHGLRLGRQIRKIGDRWWIILGAEETKSARPDERPIHEILTPYIDRWINPWRALYPTTEDYFWPSPAGGPLAYTYVGAIITETTRRELGVAVNPHLFRDCCVFTIADRAGEEMGVASALLQHVDSRVTEMHYNKGASLRAAKKFQTILFGSESE